MMEIDDRTKKALFRFEVIAPLIPAGLSKQELEVERKRILQRVYSAPDGRQWQIAERTLRGWLRRYKEHGFVGLFDADRGTFGACRAISEDVLKEAISLRKFESTLSVPQIMDLLPHAKALQGKSVDAVSKATLNRHLNKLGARKSKPRQEAGKHQRRQEDFANDMWQADTADGIWIRDPANPKRLKKTYFVSFIDDASRLVPHAQFYFDTQLPSLLDCFKKAMHKRGRPERLYADNAWIYHSTTMKLLCAELDIEPSFCTPKRPPGKGKIERHIRTCQEGFYKIAEHADIKTLDELNQFFLSWLTNKYHKSAHSELNGQTTPIERWCADKERIQRVTPAQIRRGLMLRCERRVDRKTAIVRLDNLRYQASHTLAGEKVEVRFHFNDPSEIELWQRGKLVEVATPLVLRPDIDFKKYPGKTDEDEYIRGKAHETFKAYRAALTGNKQAEPSIQTPTGDQIGEQEFMLLLAELLERQLSPDEQETVATFFFRHAPFNRSAVRAALTQVVEATGARLHPGRYCERLLEMIGKQRR
jgi:transposase InsO family protein